MAVELQRSMLRKVLPLGGADSARVAASAGLRVRAGSAIHDSCAL